MRLNACELEIDLFCRGIRVPADVPLDGARGISRTRAGLGSGLEIVIPGGSWLKDRIWVNVPVEEPFARESPYVARGVAARRLPRARRAGRRPLPGRDPAGARVVHAHDVAAASR